MIDPASMGDWIQASLMVGLVGAVGALSARALREEHERSSGGAARRPEQEAAPLLARRSASIREPARLRGG